MFHQKTLQEMWCQAPVSHSCRLLSQPNSFCRGMFKLNTKFDTDLLLYLLSHFKCQGHTVHMLTQWLVPPSLTSTVKSSLFTHAHSSPLSLAARLHRCHTDCSHYINNGWTFSRPTLYMSIPQEDVVQTGSCDCFVEWLSTDRFICLLLWKPRTLLFVTWPAREDPPNGIYL